MYEPLALSHPSSAGIGELSALAVEHHLALCVGAGVSIDSGLPSGAAMASEVERRLRDSIRDFPACDPNDLLAVANAAESMGPAALRQLQRSICEAFDLTVAEPNFAHRVLAWLLLEGAVVVATANYDTCIERAAAPERVDVVITDGQYRQGNPAVLLKIHGCATDPDSILASDQQLAAPTIWAEAEVSARLSSGSMVFLGMSDVPEYVRVRLAKLVALPIAGRFFVVSPSIRSGWSTSAWQTLLLNLPEDQKLAMTAAAFLDELLREYVRTMLERLVGRLRALDPDDHLAAGRDLVLNALNTRSSLAILEWLRSLGMQWRPGESVAHSDVALRALLGLCVLGADATITSRAVVGVGAAPAFLEDDIPIELLLSTGNRTGLEVETEARRRSTEARLRGEGGWSADEVVVLCCGHMGILGRRDPDTEDIVADRSTVSIVDGPAAARLRFRDADEILKGMG